MLAEVLLKRDPRSVSEISAPQVIAPITVLAAVLLRRDRPPIVPVVGVQSPVYDFEKSIVNNAGVVTLVNDLASPGANKSYSTDGAGVRGWHTVTGGGASYTFSDSIVEASGNVTLENDSVAPGNNKMYATNGSGIRGWLPQPSAGAPLTAHYLTTQSETGLPNEFDMSAIGAGLLKQSVTGGVATPAIAVSGTDYVDPSDSRLTNDRTANALRTLTAKAIDNAADPTNGQVLAYDSASGKWKPVTPSVDDHIANALQTLTVKPIDAAADPTNGQVLTYDSTAGKWKPVTPTGGAVSLVRGFSFGATKSAGIATGAIKGEFTCPYAGTISAWHLATPDSGTVTVKFWKRAGAYPTAANSINTSGVASSGNYVRSTTLTDFTTTTVNAGDVFVVEVTAVGGTLTNFSGSLEITT